MSVRRRLFGVGVALTLLLAGGEDARAQFTEPCQAACAVTLGASSFVFAMGTMATVGRLEDGYTTKTGPAVTFAIAFLAASGAGLAMNGNGDRQRRAIYGSALGAAGGAMVGLAAETLIGQHDTSSRWAATLIGGAIGVIAGGILGSTTYEGVNAQPPALTVVAPPIAFPAGR